MSNVTFDSYIEERVDAAATSPLSPARALVSEPQGPPKRSPQNGLDMGITLDTAAASPAVSHLSSHMGFKSDARHLLVGALQRLACEW